MLAIGCCAIEVRRKWWENVRMNSVEAPRDESALNRDTLLKEGGAPE